MQPVGRPLPHPRRRDIDDLAALCAFIAGNTARQERNIPRRLTAITRSHSSIGISSQERRESTLISEALLTSTSIEPKRSIVASAMDLVASSLAMSVSSASASEALRGKCLGDRPGSGPIDVGGHHLGAGLGEFLGIDLADPLGCRR